MSLLWLLLVVWRLGWSVLPQTGYIHPDEFFQTVEVVAGDALHNLSVVQTWEFTKTFPLRSAVLPQALFYPVFKLLEAADHAGLVKLSGYTLIASYRFLMAILSLWIDFCVYKICCIVGIPCIPAVLLLASSYVTLTFQIHTFSNSLETLLFVTLILLILEYMNNNMEVNDEKIKSNEKENRNDNVFEEQENGKSEGEMDLDSSFDNLHKIAFNFRKRNTSKSGNCDIDRREKTPMQLHTATEKYVFKDDQYCHISYTYIILIALVIVLGVFNRPTFALFAIVPFIWWSDHSLSGNKPVFLPSLLFILTGLFFSIVLSYFDTVYFNKVEFSYLFSTNSWKYLLENWVLTPLNFFWYNISPKNLQIHGQHPFYLHMLVNMPLLHGPMLLYPAKEMLYKSLNFIKLLNSEENKKEVKKLSVREKMRYSLCKSICLLIFLPVVFLSFFPHQEARFLIPLLPLVALSVILISEKIGAKFWVLHIIWNVFFSVIFGMCHQGGVVPSLIHLQQLNLDKIAKDSNVLLKIIYSHTYMPPKHLLLTTSNLVDLIDLKGNSLDTVCNKIENSFSQKSYNEFKSHHINFTPTVFLALPGTLMAEFNRTCGHKFVFKTSTFFPHLSLEDPPNLSSMNSLQHLIDMMSLYLLEFHTLK